MHLPHFHYDWAAGMNSPNFRYFKSKHPYLDTELLGTALEPAVESKIRTYESLLARMGRAPLGLRVGDVAPHVPDGERGALWVGVGLGFEGDDQWRFDHGCDAGPRNLHLLGVDTPFREREFRTVVHVDLWRFLTPEDLSLVVNESLRIGERLILFASDRLRFDAGALRTEHLDYLAQAFGSHERAFRRRDVAGGTVIDVYAA